jgi:hypothetical protein
MTAALSLRAEASPYLQEQLHLVVLGAEEDMKQAAVVVLRASTSASTLSICEGNGKRKVI